MTVINMPLRFRCFLIFFLLLFTIHYSLFTASAVYAVEPLTLKTIIEEALHNNQEVQALRQNVKAKEAMAGAEGVLDDPTLKIELEDLSKDKPLNISPGSAMQTRYTFSQMFPYPGKLSLQKRIAYTEVLMAGAELRSKEIEITKMIKDAYYEYQMITETIKINKEISDVLSNMAKIAEIKYGTGEVSQQDVIKAQVETAMLINEVINLKAEREVVDVEIKSLLNRPQDIPLSEPENISMNKVKIKPDELSIKAIRNNPSLQLMRYETDGIHLKTELAKKEYYPNIMVGIAPIQREGRFDAYDAMFEVNIPIWRSKYAGKVSEAGIMSDVMKFRLRAEENIKTAEVKEWAIKIETADKIRGLYETTLTPQAELSFESALKNYQTGKIDFLTLLDTERLLKKTKIEYIESLITYRKRIAALEQIVGEEIAE
ncbi:MAG: TolC family protein [Nitrospirae bacterium]|nr:TolC family protein [Nitrospirota bacterium]